MSSDLLCIAWRYLGWMGILMAHAAAEGGPARVPFFDPRTQYLEYHGSDEDPIALDRLPEINLGWFGPADPADPAAGDLWWSAALALEEANAAGGYSGRPYRLVPCWSANPWGTGVASLFRAVYDESLRAIVGSVDGPTTHLAEQVVAKARLPLLSPLSTDPSVNLAGVAWMFSCAPNDGQIAPVLTEAALAVLEENPGDLIVLAGIDHDSRVFAGEIVKALGRRGRLPDYRFELPAHGGVPEAQVMALNRTSPGTLILVADAATAAAAMPTLRQALPGCPILGDHRLGRRRFLQTVGPTGEGVIVPLLFWPKPQDAVATRFSERFRARYDAAPDYAAALAYDATRLLIQAIDRTDLSRARIRESLLEVSGWEGIAGTVRWDSLGQNVRAVGLGVVRGGELVPLEPRHPRGIERQGT
jgi:branched-chain amino acid transport system substrate-binding protein